MRNHPTLEQFSHHPCIHWEMRGEGEYCTAFGKLLDALELCCNPTCPRYDPLDCHLEELLTEKNKEEQR